MEARIFFQEWRILQFITEAIKLMNGEYGATSCEIGSQTSFRRR